MSTNQDPPTGNQPPGGQNEPTLADVVKQLTEFKTGVEQRLEGMSRKHQEQIAELKGRREPENPPGSSNPPTNNGGVPRGEDRKDPPSPFDAKAFREEVRAEVKIDAARERMNDEQRKQLDSFLKTHGARATVDVLDLIAPPSPGGDPGANPPRGSAAMPAQAGVGKRPETISEFKELKKKDPKTAQALEDDPDFEFSQLKNR